MMDHRDLEQIRLIVREEVRQEIVPLEQKVDQNHEELIIKIDQIRNMESEDIAPLYEAKNDHGRRIKKLEKSLSR